VTIKPLGDRIVLEAIEKEEKTASGIVFPIRRRKNRRKDVWSPSVPAVGKTVRKSNWK